MAIGGDGDGKSKFVLKFKSGDGLLRLYSDSLRLLLEFVVVNGRAVFESQDGRGPGSKMQFFCDLLKLPVFVFFCFYKLPSFSFKKP